MKRIGVLLDRTDCDSCLAAIIDKLAENPDVELRFIVNEEPAAEHAGFLGRVGAILRRKGIRHGIGDLAFRLLSGLELRLLGRFSRRAADFLRRKDVARCTGDEIIRISPSFSKSGLYVHYSDDDLLKLRTYKFDLLIRGNNSGILRGGILETAKDGILSFHHGDNSWNRGGPPGFWEVYDRRPMTGFVIQKLTEELDGGEVVLKGSFATRPTYSQNVVHLQTESNVHFIRLLEDYVRSGALPRVHRPMPYGERLLVFPTLSQSLAYCLRSLAYAARAGLRQIGRRDVRWQIAFVACDWQRASLRKGHVVANPPGRFLADPFVVERNGRTICFVEDYDFAVRKAGISALELRRNGTYDFIGRVLEEPFHMSFPHLFEFEGQLYMVPETIETRTLRLYLCEQFPMKWRLVATPMTGISAADPMIFRHGSLWWLAANVAPAGAIDSTSQLHLFHSEDPLRGAWTPHRDNPVVFDSRCARNAGLLVGESGELFRVSQRQDFGTYGAGINIAEVVRLDEHGYEERIVHQIGPRFFRGIAMCHHMHSNGRFTVFDFARWERIR